MSASWTQADAIAVAKTFETIAPGFGCHIALTGGCLYRDGERQDCDFVFYRIRQVEQIDIPGLLEALSHAGLLVHHGFGFCVKATWQGKSVDLLFPEEQGGAYQDSPEGGVA